MIPTRVGEIWALKDIMTNGAVDKIIADTGNGTAVGVIDCSFKEELGTSSWVVESSTDTHHITGNIWIPGHHNDHSAYRSEIEGIY